MNPKVMERQREIGRNVTRWEAVDQKWPLERKHWGRCSWNFQLQKVGSVWLLWYSGHGQGDGDIRVTHNRSISFGDVVEAAARLVYTTGATFVRVPALRQTMPDQEFATLLRTYVPYLLLEEE